MSGLSYFAAQVRQQGILAGSVSFLIAGAVVAVELTVGIWLMAHVRRAAALWTAIVLLAAFSVYLVALIELAGDQPCACYGSFSGQMASSALWRNAGLSALAVLGLAAQRQERRSLA